MARTRKPVPTIDSLLFSTPEQKLLRFMVTEATTVFTIRVLSSRLKGIRGLGGAEGILKILQTLEEVGLVQFLDHNRSVALNNEAPAVHLLKQIVSMCDLEGLTQLVQPVSKRGILYGSRAEGKSRSDSDYNLFVVSDQLSEATQMITTHPLGKRIAFTIWSEDEYASIDKKDPKLAQTIKAGVILWGPTW